MKDGRPFTFAGLWENWKDPQTDEWIRTCSRYALRLYSWAKKYVASGAKRISLEQLRKVLGLDSVTDVDGNVIQEAPLQVWANLRQRALDPAIAEINKKTDLSVVLESLGRSKHRRVTTLTFSIKAQARENSEG
jgi:plasmid replication initiation protein